MLCFYFRVRLIIGISTMIKSLQDPNFSHFKKIHHGFFTRSGGVSEGYYSSLNCATKSYDDPERVQENRRRAMAHFDYPLDALATVKNVHGNKVIIIEESKAVDPNVEADGMVT